MPSDAVVEDIDQQIPAHRGPATGRSSLGSHSLYIRDKAEPRSGEDPAKDCKVSTRCLTHPPAQTHTPTNNFPTPTRVLLTKDLVFSKYPIFLEILVNCI